jgi:Carboxypeptidase regulatory-like domain
MTVPIRFPKITSSHCNFSRIVAIALCVLLATTAAFAQFTAGLQGNIRDTGGANIPNAQMILLDTATKVQQSGTSDASGLYRFTNLGPGEYQISSSAKGFQRTQAQFTLTAGENRDLSLVLAVGSDTTSIVVTAQAPLLDTGDSREQLTLNQSAPENLPLATRNPISLLGLTPGVYGDPGTDYDI